MSSLYCCIVLLQWQKIKNLHKKKPCEVLPELLVEPDWVIILVEDAEQINHATKEPQKLPLGCHVHLGEQPCRHDRGD